MPNQYRTMLRKFAKAPISTHKTFLDIIVGNPIDCKIDILFFGRLTEEFVETGRQLLKDIGVLVSVIQDNERRLQNNLIYELPPEYPSWKTHLNQMAKEYVQKLHTVWVAVIKEELELTDRIGVENILLQC